MTGTLLYAWLGLLLVGSASLSSSETALFSLEPNDRRRAGRRVVLLLERPENLLITVLFGNLTINLLFFAFAQRIEIEGVHDVVLGLLVLVVLLLFGEIFPKALALRSPVAVARFFAPPLQVLIRAVKPLRRLVAAVLRFTLDMLGARDADEGITSEMLASVLEKSASDGLLEVDEAELLGEVIELEEIRVREIMTPRVDMLGIDQTAEDPLAVVPLALERRLSWLPVLDGNADQVVGRVKLRDLLPEPSRALPQLVMPVKFVPEVASAGALLRALRADRTAGAVVVDEWGGTAGVVTLEDVFEEIVGELRVEGEERAKPVVPLGEGRFRVTGSLSVRDWNDLFGRKVVPREFETVGGLVTAILGRIPRVGDEVRLGSLVAEVQEMRGRRLVSVDMYVDGAREREKA